MNDFIAVQSLDSPIDGEKVRWLARHGCLNIHRVEWLGAWLASTGQRLLCWYRAADAESVRLVLRHQGLDSGAVRPVNSVFATDLEIAPDTEYTIVESDKSEAFSSDTPEAARAFQMQEGGAIVVATGIFTFHRERKLALEEAANAKRRRGPSCSNLNIHRLSSLS